MVDNIIKVFLISEGLTKKPITCFTSKTYETAKCYFYAYVENMKGIYNLEKLGHFIGKEFNPRRIWICQKNTEIKNERPTEIKKSYEQIKFESTEKIIEKLFKGRKVNEL